MDIIKDKISKSAGFKRVEMPQIEFDDLQRTIAGLLSKGVGIKIRRISASKLKFAQNEIDESKVQEKVDSKSKQFKERLYFASRGLFVADGHHDLAQGLKVAPRTKLTCLVCDISIYELVEILNSFKFTTNEDIQKALHPEKVMDKRGFITTRMKSDAKTEGGIRLKIISQKDFDSIMELAPEFGAPNYGEEELKSLSGVRFNQGFCDVFAFYMEQNKGYKSHDYHDSYKVRVIKDLEGTGRHFPEHAFVSKVVNGKTLFFDIEEQDGVKSPFDLPFYKRFLNSLKK